MNRGWNAMLLGLMAALTLTAGAEEPSEACQQGGGPRGQILDASTPTRTASSTRASASRPARLAASARASRTATLINGRRIVTATAIDQARAAARATTGKTRLDRSAARA